MATLPMSAVEYCGSLLTPPATDDEAAIPVPWIAARLLNQATRATTLSKSMLVAAIVSAGLVYLTAASHVRGAVAPIEPVRSAEVVNTIVPASVDTAHRAAGASSAHASLLPLSGTFRFGFLEFEDAPAE